MNNYFLITRPNHDVTTNYLYYWSTKIITEAEKKGFEVIDLKGERANKKEFVSVINKTRPSFVVLNGHGNEEAVAGFDNKNLIKVGDNERLLNEKISYAVSCRSAKILGSECVRQGAKAYIGYEDDFTFLVDETKITKPLEDKTAEFFLEPSNQIAISLLKGNNTGNSYQKSQQYFRRNIRRSLTSETASADKENVPFLLWDMKHQVCLGDQNASLSD